MPKKAMLLNASHTTAKRASAQRSRTAGAGATREEEPAAGGIKAEVEAEEAARCVSTSIHVSSAAASAAKNHGSYAMDRRTYAGAAPSTTDTRRSR